MQCQHNGDAEQFIQKDILLIDVIAAVNQIKKIIHNINLQGKHVYFLSNLAEQVSIYSRYENQLSNIRKQFSYG